MEDFSLSFCKTPLPLEEVYSIVAAVERRLLLVFALHLFFLC